MILHFIENSLSVVLLTQFGVQKVNNVLLIFEANSWK